jgi:hypothetical protein
MQGLTWAFGLREVDPAVKLLAVYIGNGVVSARYRDIDVDAAAEFCGLGSPRTVVKLAKQLPDVTFTHVEGSRTIRFDLRQVVERA